MHLDSNTTTTMTLSNSPTPILLTADRDEDGTWIVSDRVANVWGTGRSLLEAMCDYWSGLLGARDVMTDEKLSQRLAFELRAVNQRLEQRTD